MIKKAKKHKIRKKESKEAFNQGVFFAFLMHEEETL